MMVESEGKGIDSLQATNSPFNDKYPSGITDPDYVDKVMQYIGLGFGSI